MGAIFFSQITMLNMLIAIMADVFENLTEKRHVKSISTKLEILAEQAPLLAKQSKSDEQNVYMIVIEPVEDEDYENEEWQGSIKELSNITQRQINELKNALNKKSDKMQAISNKKFKETRAETEAIREELSLIKASNKEIEQSVKKEIKEN